MKDKIIVFLFISYIFLFSFLHIYIKDLKISKSERRYLDSFPTFKLDSEFINNVDEYLLDHFPFRDEFRSLKAKFNYNILKKLDNNGIYIKNNYIFKNDYPTNNKSVDYFIDNCNKLSQLFTERNNLYLLAIPDKNYYVNDELFLNINYDHIYSKINKLDMTMIDIREIMNLADYYETDTHWKQEKLLKVIEQLSKYMNFNYEETTYIKNKFNDFYGVYYKEAAINRKPEVITYLTNDVIDNAYVKYLENNKINSVYNLDNLNKFDSYEVFLDGASSYIEIYNKSSKNNKELVIFRDSFASSITPLLIKYYFKITLIDNRYITSDNFMKYIEFNNQDVLFLYSTMIINNSFSLKG